MECQFCKKQLKTISSLNHHQTTAKYCLKIQGKTDDKFTCEFCKKVFTTKDNLRTHNNSCKEKKEKIALTEKEKIKNSYISVVNENSELKDTIENLKDIIEKMKEELYDLKGQIKILSKNNDCLQDIAKQPKISNSNNNNKILTIQSHFDFNNTEHVKQLIEEKYDRKYLFQGQKGVAQFAADYILKDDNGEFKYICTDPSRQIFKYKDSEGFIKKDIEAKKLTGFLVNSGIQEKTHDVAIEFWTDENGEVDGEKCSTLLEPAQSVKNIKNDNTVFKKELINIITK
jgi:hypothetical protein